MTSAQVVERQSTTTVLLRTTLTRTITLYDQLVSIICKTPPIPSPFTVFLEASSQSVDKPSPTWYLFSPSLTKEVKITRWSGKKRKPQHESPSYLGINIVTLCSYIATLCVENNAQFNCGKNSYNK